MYTVDTLISQGRGRISWSQRHELKNSLDHGKNILETDDQLAAYLSWYGEMHKLKCFVATQNFPYESLGLRIHIVDWGCGQAIASLCFLETLEQRGLLSYVQKITLIEPSVVALSRAKECIEQAVRGHSVIIETICQKLPSNKNQIDTLSLNLDCKTTVHLFSNILDLVDISLLKIAEIIEAGLGTHYVLCMGPCNENKDRIDDFCNYFTERTEFSNIEDRCIAHTSDTNYPITCKTRCFFIQTANSHIDCTNTEGQYSESGAYDDYDTDALVRSGLLTEKLLRVYKHISQGLSIYDKIYLKPEMGCDTPDLVIVRKWKGIVVMNVFEEDLSECKYDTKRGFTCHDIAIASPLSTVIGYCDNILTEKSSTLLRNAIKEKNGWYVVRPAVWFPDASRDQIGSVFNIDKEKSKLILLGSTDFNRDVLEALDLKHSRSSFTEEAYNEFIGLLKTGWHSFRDGNLSLHLRPEQAPLAISENGKKQKIKGVAGSGKTQVLASRAVNCQLRTGGNVLILTYNITLVNYIHYRIKQIPADFLWNKFTITNYHRFFSSQARNHNIKMDKDGKCFNSELFFAREKDNLTKYSAILVDEVQDYEYVWLRILLKYFLADDGEFVLFGDAKQNIYKRALDTDKEIRTPIPGKWTERLNIGQRFSNPRIASLAMSFQRFFLPDQDPDSIESQLEIGFSSDKVVVSNKDVVYEAFPSYTQARIIADSCLNFIDSNKLERRNTVILSQKYAFLRWVEQYIRKRTHLACMTTYETQEVYDKLLSEYEGDANNEQFKYEKKRVRDNKKLHFTMDSDLLKLSSIHSYKGWDAENVILIIQPEDEYYDREDGMMGMPELVYTAITRAKSNLFILNLDNKKFDQFFRKQNY